MGPPMPCKNRRPSRHSWELTCEPQRRSRTARTDLQIDFVCMSCRPCLDRFLYCIEWQILQPLVRQLETARLRRVNAFGWRYSMQPVRSFGDGYGGYRSSAFGCVGPLDACRMCMFGSLALAEAKAPAAPAVKAKPSHIAPEALRVGKSWFGRKFMKFQYKSHRVIDLEWSRPCWIVWWFFSSSPSQQRVHLCPTLHVSMLKKYNAFEYA